MTRCCLLIIEFYQRFLSPFKGFHCAHHKLHRGDTCSNAVKSIISEHGVIRAWPLVRARFKECRNACEILLSAPAGTHRSDLPCDLPCDVSFGDCGLPGGGGKSANITCCCDFADPPKLSRKNWMRVIVTTALIITTAMYWFYGRAVNAVYLTDLGQTRQDMLQRLIQRDSPQVRILLLTGDGKFYSDIIRIEQENQVYRLEFDNGPLDYQLNGLQVLDARLQVGGELLVVGQILEQFDQPGSRGQGERFSYRIKRRWHFW